MTGLFAPPNDEQALLIDIVARSFLEHSCWPVWQHVERRFDDKGLELYDVLLSLPVIGDGPPISVRYGLVWFDHFGRGADSPIRLRLAAGLHHDDYRARVVEPLLAVLQWFIERYRAVPTAPDSVTQVTVTATELHQAMPHINEHLLARIPELFRHEPFNLIGSNAQNGTYWHMELLRHLLKYRQVRTLEDYVRRVVELIERDSASSSLGSIVKSVDVQPHAPTTSYVDNALLADLERKRGQTAFNLDKLLGFLLELNKNYSLGHPYSCHALLRATLDHVPPIFGYMHFADMVAQYGMSKTDKDYMRKLEDFKTQGHDVLHRQISGRRDLITMDDMPVRASVNALLHLIIDAL